MSRYMKIVYNFQSMESPEELNCISLKCFCYVTWFDERQNWQPCQGGLLFKSYCFFETIASRFENRKMKGGRKHQKL